MRRGYIIRDRARHAYLAGRVHQATKPGEEKPVTVWVKKPEQAWEFGKLKECRRMQRLLRGETWNPDAVQIIDPKWRIVT